MNRVVRVCSSMRGPAKALITFEFQSWALPETVVFVEERESVCVCVCVCERECVCVCVCV